MRFPGLIETELKGEIERLHNTVDPCSSETLYMEWLENELVLRELEVRVSELVDAIINEAVPASFS